MKAREGGTCVICRKNYSRGDDVSDYGGFRRHVRCIPIEDLIRR